MSKQEFGRKVVALVVFVLISWLIPQLLLPYFGIDFLHPYFVMYLIVGTYGFLSWVWGKAGLIRVLIILALIGLGAYVLGLQAQLLGIHRAFGWGLATLVSLLALWPRDFGKKPQGQEDSQREVDARIGNTTQSMRTGDGEVAISLRDIIGSMQEYTGFKSLDAFAEFLGERNKLFNTLYERLVSSGVSERKALIVAAKAAKIEIDEDLLDLSFGSSGERKGDSFDIPNITFGEEA